MPIAFTCPHCGHHTIVADEYTGTSGPCVECKQTVQIPAAPVTAQGSQEFDSTTRMLLPVGRSPWAIVAGYAGLFAFTIFLAPIALIVGIIAVRDLRRNPKQHGMGRAVFGLITGAVGTGFLIFMIIAISLGG